MRFRLSISFLLFVLVLSACTHAPDTSPQSPTMTGTPAGTPDPVAEVRAIYAKDCQNCHAVDGTGGKVKLDDGKTLRVPSFREGHALKHSDTDFVRQIKEGGDGMPAFKDKLSAAQTDELIRFIRKEFQPGHVPPAEKAPKQ